MKRWNGTITSLIAFGTISVFLSGVLQQALAQPPSATLAFFTDRPTFEASTGVCALANENFEDTNVGPGDITVCTGPFDSTSNDACYSTGALLPGFGVDDVTGVSEMVVLTQGGLFGAPSTIVGPNFFDDDTDITFSAGDIGAAGFDLVDLDPLDSGRSTWSIEFFGPGGSLGSTPATASGFGSFIGASSSSNIVRIEIRPISGTAAELIDNLCFGLTVTDSTEKITMCHKGKVTITIAEAAVSAHFRHGDIFGACPTNSLTVTTIPGPKIGSSSTLKTVPMKGPRLKWSN